MSFLQCMRVSAGVFRGPVALTVAVGFTVMSRAVVKIYNANSQDGHGGGGGGGGGDDDR